MVVLVFMDWNISATQTIIENCLWSFIKLEFWFRTWLFSFACLVQATGTPIGVILQSINTIAISIGLSIYYQWKLGLSISCFVPIVLVSFYMQTRIIMGQDTIEKKAFEASAKVYYTMLHKQCQLRVQSLRTFTWSTSYKMI